VHLGLKDPDAALSNVGFDRLQGSRPYAVLVRVNRMASTGERGFRPRRGCPDAPGGLAATLICFGSPAALSALGGSFRPAIGKSNST
jgi:hypothetical protein